MKAPKWLGYITTLTTKRDTRNPNLFIVSFTILGFAKLKRGYGCLEVWDYPAREVKWLTFDAKRQNVRLVTLQRIVAKLQRKRRRTYYDEQALAVLTDLLKQRLQEVQKPTAASTEEGLVT